MAEKLLNDTQNIFEHAVDVVKRVGTSPLGSTRPNSDTVLQTAAMLVLADTIARLDIDSTDIAAAVRESFSKERVAV